MTKMDMTLTWALPVKVEVLGAHLEAYLETLPNINALRLCNCFGTGPEAHISKLPIELLTHIEAEIIEPVRQTRLSAWSQNFKCFEQTCTWRDHYDLESVQEMYWDCVADRTPNSEDNEDEPLTEDEMAEALGLGQEDHWEYHWDTREA